MFCECLSFILENGEGNNVSESLSISSRLGTESIE